MPARMLHVLPRCWCTPRVLVHRAVVQPMLGSPCEMSSEAKGNCERRGGQEGKSCLTADSSWQHTGWVVDLPHGSGSVLQPCR